MSALLAPLFDSRRPDSLASRLRRVRARLLTRMVTAKLAARGTCRIVDLGGTPTYWRVLGTGLERMPNVSITIVNCLDLSSECCGLGFAFLQADATALDGVGDKTFDICHSNSVIEHVGPWKLKKRFADETSRIAEAYYVQTPNYWFPVEPHAVFPGFQFMPKPWRVGLVQRFALGWYPRASALDEAIATVESADLLTRGMLCRLFPDAEIHTERFGPLAKSFVAVRW
jgi:hypothetical protein